MFDEEHQRENFFHMSPFHSSVEIRSGKISPATMAYQHHSNNRTTLDWSSLEQSTYRQTYSIRPTWMVTER